MPITRRNFIKNTSLVSVIMSAGGGQVISSAELFDLRKKVRLRFIVASDSHYGQPDTPFDEMVETFVKKANYFNESQKVDFCVLNGDLIHDEAHLMPLVKPKFDKLRMPYYVTKGNHDRISDETWLDIWGMPVNHSFKQGKNAFILVTTSDEVGTYLSPNLDWLKKTLENYKKARNTFLFVHIPQKKWTKHAIDTRQFMDLVSTYSNVKAVFHGHEHDEDGIKIYNKIPFIFDSHIGGSWGTDYKGFRVVEVLKDNSIVTYMMNPEKGMDKVVL